VAAPARGLCGFNKVFAEFFRFDRPAPLAVLNELLVDVKVEVVAYRLSP